MLRPSQMAICGSLAVAFWVVAALCIRLDPGFVGDGLQGDLGFVASIPVCWLCIRMICRAAKLEPHQVLAGCLVVLGDAMMIDGVALRWFPEVYSVSDQIARGGAAWLLWGYGLSAWIALIMADRAAKRAGAGVMRPAAS